MIYLDYNATTPINESVCTEMESVLHRAFGNPSSTHSLGRAAKEVIETARRRTADSLGCAPDEIVFTSGGTESNNLAIIGTAFANRSKGNKIVTSLVEHSSVLETCRYLEKRGFSVTYLKPDHTGRIIPEKLENAVTHRTVLVTIQHANNETGTIQPISEIAEICYQKKVLMHTDAVQSLGKIETKASELGADLISISGHKIYGPNGIGALYIRKGTAIDPILHGGGQEFRLRSGTENTPGIAGLGKACEIIMIGLKKNYERMKFLRDKFEEQILTSGLKVRINGNPYYRLPNTTNLCFIGKSGLEIVKRLGNEIAISSASACATCNSAVPETSHVLIAMGLSKAEADNSIRISLGVPTTEDEVNEAALRIIDNVKYMNRQA